MKKIETDILNQKYLNESVVEEKNMNHPMNGI